MSTEDDNEARGPGRKAGGDPAKGPRLSDDGKARRDQRQARQAEALRANLRKRKAQRRGRDEDGAG